MEFDLWRYAIMGASLAAGALVKGATGMGLPLIALPVLTTAFGLQHAVGIMAITQVLTNGMQIWQFREARREEAMGFLPWFLVAGGFGVVLGTFLLSNLPERILVFSLGVLLLASSGALPSRTLSSTTMRIGAVFSSAAREALEMAYQNTQPYVFDSTAFEREFGVGPTPYAEGIRATLAAA